MAHANDAVKAFEKATPTVDANSKVIRWDIDYSYTLNGYKVTYKANLEQIKDGEEVFALKAVSEFTKAELIALLPLDHWNMIYDSQYESTHPVVAAPVTTTNSSFDVNTLS